MRNNESEMILSKEDEEEIEECRRSVKVILIEQYNQSEEEAAELINNSPFDIIMREQFNFAFYYDVDFWINRIVKANNLVKEN